MTPDGFEHASERTVKLTLMVGRVKATWREQQHGCAPRRRNCGLKSLRR